VPGVRGDGLREIRGKKMRQARFSHWNFISRSRASVSTSMGCLRPGFPSGPQRNPATASHGDETRARRARVEAQPQKFFRTFCRWFERVKIEVPQAADFNGACNSRYAAFLLVQDTTVGEPHPS
jgi:hypothetical protein